MQCIVDGCSGGRNDLFRRIPQRILAADAAVGFIIGILVGCNDVLNSKLCIRDGIRHVLLLRCNIVCAVGGGLLRSIQGIDCGAGLLILGLGGIDSLLILLYGGGVVLDLPPGSDKVIRVPHVLSAQLLHILAHGAPRQIFYRAVGELELLIRQAEGGQQLIVGSRHAGIGFFNLCLRSRQLGFVLSALNQHIVVLVIEGVQVFLPGLSLGICYIGIRMLAQRSGAALDGIGLKVNIIRKAGNQNRQPGQRVVVFGISVRVPICGGLDGLQLADVLVRNAGGRCHVGQGGIVACACFFHTVAHVTSGAGQFLYRGHRRIGRTRQTGNDRGQRRARQGNSDQHRGSRAKRGSKQPHCGTAHLDGGRDRSQHREEAAQSNRAGCNAIDYAWIFFYKSLHPAQDFRADIVQIRHHRGQILADGDF